MAIDEDLQLNQSLTLIERHALLEEIYSQLAQFSIPPSVELHDLPDDVLSAPELGLYDPAPVLPRFTGVHPDKWLAYAERYFMYYRIPYMLNYFHNEAAMWLSFYQFTEWSDFIESLVRRFGYTQNALKVFDEMPDVTKIAVDKEVHNTIDNQVLTVQKESMVDVNEPLGVKDAQMDILDYKFGLESVTESSLIHGQKHGLLDTIANVIADFDWKPGWQCGLVVQPTGTMLLNQPSLIVDSVNYVAPELTGSIFFPNQLDPHSEKRDPFKLGLCTPKSLLTICFDPGPLFNYAIVLACPRSYFDVELHGMNFCFVAGPFLVIKHTFCRDVVVFEPIGAALLEFSTSIVGLTPLAITHIVQKFKPFIGVFWVVQHIDDDKSKEKCVYARAVKGVRTPNTKNVVLVFQVGDHKYLRWKGGTSATIYYLAATFYKQQPSIAISPSFFTRVQQIIHPLMLIAKYIISFQYQKGVTQLTWKGGAATLLFSNGEPGLKISQSIDTNFGFILLVHHAFPPFLIANGITSIQPLIPKDMTSHKNITLQPNMAFHINYQYNMTSLFGSGLQIDLVLTTDTGYLMGSFYTLSKQLVVLIQENCAKLVVIQFCRTLGTHIGRSYYPEDMTYFSVLKHSDQAHNRVFKKGNWVHRVQNMDKHGLLLSKALTDCTSDARKGTFLSSICYGNTKEIANQCILVVHRKLTVDYQVVEVNLERCWKMETMHNVVNKTTQIGFSGLVNDYKAFKKATFNKFNMGLNVREHLIKECTSLGRVCNEFFERVAVPKLVEPTIVFDYPVEVSPLAKRRQRHASLTKLYELFNYEREFGNAISKFTNPFGQRRWVDEQVKEHNQTNTAILKDLDAKGDDGVSHTLTLYEDFSKASNDQSKRFCLIVMVHVLEKDVHGGSTSRCCYLVELIESEQVAKAEVIGKGPNRTLYVNMFSCFGKVITTFLHLHPYIPYKNKFLLLLQSSPGGNAHTLFTYLSPKSDSFMEPEITSFEALYGHKPLTKTRCIHRIPNLHLEDKVYLKGGSNVMNVVVQAQFTSMRRQRTQRSRPISNVSKSPTRKIDRSML